MALIALNAVVVASSVMVPASGQPEILKAIVKNTAQPGAVLAKTLKQGAVNVTLPGSNAVASPVRRRLGDQLTATTGQQAGTRPKK